MLLFLTLEGILGVLLWMTNGLYFDLDPSDVEGQFYKNMTFSLLYTAGLIGALVWSVKSDSALIICGMCIPMLIVAFIIIAMLMNARFYLVEWLDARKRNSPRGHE